MATMGIAPPSGRPVFCRIALINNDRRRFDNGVGQDKVVLLGQIEVSDDRSGYIGLMLVQRFLHLLHPAVGHGLHANAILPLQRLQHRGKDACQFALFLAGKRQIVSKITQTNGTIVSLQPLLFLCVKGQPARSPAS